MVMVTENHPISDPAMPKIDFESFFKIGESDDYILMSRDFPMKDISPGDFTRLIRRMFEKNDEVRHGK